MPKLSFFNARLAALLFTAFLVSCSKREEKNTASVPLETREVQTVRVEKRPMQRTLEVTGSLLAREQANISVKVPGRIKTLSVDIGSPVKKGEVVGQVDPRDYELRLQLAQAALAQARALLGVAADESEANVDLEKTSGVEAARAVLDEAEKNRERAVQLQKEGVSSRLDLDTAEAAFKVARERYKASLEEARVRQAAIVQRKAEVDLAQQQLTDTTIRIPYDGIIQARLANLGEFVSGGAQVVSVVQIDPLRLRLEVPERASAGVQAGQNVKLAVEGRTNVFSGTINRVSPALNEANRMLLVEADVPNPGALRPGQFVRAEIILKENEEGWAIPPKALIVFAGLEKVVAVEDGKALEKNVKTGRRGKDWVEIVSGIQGSETVILNPGGLRSGQPVKAGKSMEANSLSSVEKPEGRKP